MAAMPIYGKNLKKSSSPEPIPNDLETKYIASCMGVLPKLFKFGVRMFRVSDVLGKLPYSSYHCIPRNSFSDKTSCVQIETVFKYFVHFSSVHKKLLKVFHPV